MTLPPTVIDTTAIVDILRGDPHALAWVISIERQPAAARPALRPSMTP